MKIVTCQAVKTKTAITLLLLNQSFSSLVHFFSYKTKQVFDRFRQEVNKADTAVDKLRNLIRIHLEEFQRNKEMAVVYQAEIHQKSRLVEAQIREMAKMYFGIVTEIVEQGQIEGYVRKDLYVGLVKRFILGAVDEVINTWLHSEDQYDLALMADPLVELFFKGIGTSRINEIVLQ